MSKIQSFLILIIFALFGCADEKTANLKSVKNSRAQAKSDSLPKVVVAVDSAITIALAPPANNYEFSMAGYNIEPWIEKYLELERDIRMIKIPYHKMNGSGFHGLYRKQDCKQILKHIQPDYLMLVYLFGDAVYPNKSEGMWGYEMKVVDVKNDTIFKVLSGTKFHEFKDIEGHLRKNIGKVVNVLKQRK